jgi:hypothetical protein
MNPDYFAYSEANRQPVEQLYLSFERRDIAGVLGTLNDDIDWLFYGPDIIPFAGHYNGRAEVEQFFHKALTHIEFLEFEPQEFFVTPHYVLVQGREKCRAKATGRVWETNWAHVFTLEAGRISKMREYYDTAAIADAFKP